MSDKIGDMDEDIDDGYVMPFGKYRGKMLVDIPAAYLLWFADEAENPPEFIVSYVTKRRTQLEQEVEDENGY